jgi:hypothetical protein
VIGRGLCVLSSRSIWRGLCVLRFKYLAAPTRRTTVTAFGTGLPNHCLHQATGSMSSTLSFPCILAVYLIVTIRRHRLKTFSTSSFLFLQSLCLQTAYPVYKLPVLCFVSSHHDDYATALLSMYLSTYSAACSSLLRKFLK